MGALARSSHPLAAFAFFASFVFAGLAGCLSQDGVETASAPVPSGPPPPTGEPRVVIAVIDTGMNFYHAEYRRAVPVATSSVDGSVSPPAALVPDALPISLSLDVADWEDAVDQDKERLMELEPKTLYAFPGTKVVGAISFWDNPADWPLLLDRPRAYTHGTMTTSRATGNTVSIGGDDPGISLVLVQGFNPGSDNVAAVRWAGEQPWIDIISVSSGITGLGSVPGAANTYAAGIAAFNDASHRKPMFASSGNGVANAGLLGFPSWLRGPSGAPDVISVGANDNDQISHWHNQDSYVAADGCANPAAAPGDVEKVGPTGGGTSSATPFSAGGGAKILLEARRILHDTEVGPRVDGSLAAPEGSWASLGPKDHQIVLARGDAGLVASGPLADGVFTLLEFKDVLYHTALVTPTADESDGIRCDPTSLRPFGGTYVPASAVPERARWPFQGYGEVNHASIDAAVQVLRGDVELPARPHDDEQYVRAHHTKKAVVGDAG